MPTTGHAVRRHSALMLSATLIAFCTVWLAIGLVHVWAHPLLGWLPLPIGSVLAGHGCWAVTRQADLDDGTRRFWRRMTVACGLFTAGIVANAWDATGGGAPSQRIGPVTLICYLAVLGVVLWALLRLPSWQRSRSDWIRFGIDALIVLLTVSAVVWNFSLSNHQQWVTQTGSAGAMLAISVVGFLSMATFVKVAFAGAGRLNRRAIYILATGSAVSAAFGSLSPFLIDRPYLSSSLIAVPLAAFSIQVAAEVQRRAGNQPPADRRHTRRISVVPYLAVAVTDALLLSARAGHERAIAAAAVALTGLVVTRQIIALRDNNALLTTVDTQLHDLRCYQEKLTHQALHDVLTGLPNRALFEQRARQLSATDEPFYAALLDLDDFKAVNDRHGHHHGDQLIVEIGRRLADLLGPRPTVARLGGDEFALLLPAGRDDIEPLLDDILTSVQQPHRFGGNVISTGASIGITVGAPGDEPAELLRRADVAMYAAKADGGHRWNWFDPGMDRAADEAAQMADELREAVGNDQIFALYQPIVDLGTGTPVGAEVLLRWRHPTRGLIGPDVFIPLAERTGSIAALGHWVLVQACRQAARWQDELGDRAPGRISVNVSARQLADPSFVDTVADVLADTGADPARLMIEVTETAVLNTGTAVDQLHRLRALGVRIALDDFGTGHSSLSLLVECPVDLLKVDKSFVSGESADQAGAIVVKNLIGFTTDFGIDAVAEGVETPAQAARLVDNGYRLAQGYLFGRPMSAEAIEAAFTAPQPVTAAAR
jgi:diguanylate cyclase